MKNGLGLFLVLLLILGIVMVACSVAQENAFVQNQIVEVKNQQMVNTIDWSPIDEFYWNNGYCLLHAGEHAKIVKISEINSNYLLLQSTEEPVVGNPCKGWLPKELVHEIE